LDGGGCGAWLGGQHFVEAANALDYRVGAGGIHYGAVADYVVYDDYGAWAREVQGPGEVRRVVLFVGVDEDQVEGAVAFGG